MMSKSPTSDFVVPAKPSPPTTSSAPAAASAMPPARAAVARSPPSAIAAPSANTGTVVIRIEATCAEAKERPARKSVWLITTPRMAVQRLVGTVAAFPVNPISESAATDSELIARTLGGDGNAYGILVDRFQRRIYRVAYAIVRDDVEADTITQDTFVQAYVHLAKFEGRSEFETWLTRIAINRSRDSLRRRRFVSLFSRDDDDESHPIIEPVDAR